MSETVPSLIFQSKQDAFRRGVRHAIGAPAGVLFAGYIGFGALCHSLNLSIWTAAGSAFFVYALPGQIVMAEMFALGVSTLLTTLAVGLTASRFLPMTLTVLPQFDAQHRGSKSLYAMVHLLAMTSWAVAMRDLPKMEPQYRQAYFWGIGLVCWGVCAPGAVIGYLLADQVPVPLTMALVFLNPLFFMLSFTEVKPAAYRLAILFGSLLGPISHSLAPDYSLLISGLVGGSLAYLVIHRRHTSHGGGHGKSNGSDASQ
jgi:predicted branched-subunit amino acid permease